MEDSNTAYNVTLDLVIDAIERRIQDNQIVTATEPNENPRAVIIIEDGIVSTVLASDPEHLTTLWEDLETSIVYCRNEDLAWIGNLFRLKISPRMVSP